MKVRKYSLICLGLLLVVVILLPDHAMAPPPPLQMHKEQMQIRMVQICGYVNLPGGRGLRDVKIHLYEIRDGGTRFLKETITNRDGFYSLTIGGGEKNLWLVPNYAEFAFGEHFEPREYRFPIMDVTTRVVHRFIYTGPLPDLVVPEPHGNVHINLEGGKCRFFFPIKNAGGLDTRHAFKVKVRYWDRSAGYGPRAVLKERIVPYRILLCPGCTGAIHESGGWGVVLGPGEPGDASPPGGRMSLESASGRYEVTLIELDCDDEVVEGIEGNNRFP